MKRMMVFLAALMVVFALQTVSAAALYGEHLFFIGAGSAGEPHRLSINRAADGWSSSFGGDRNGTGRNPDTQPPRREILLPTLSEEAAEETAPPPTSEAEAVAEQHKEAPPLWDDARVPGSSPAESIQALPQTGESGGLPGGEAALSALSATALLAWGGIAAIQRGSKG